MIANAAWSPMSFGLGIAVLIYALLGWSALDMTPPGS